MRSQAQVHVILEQGMTPGRVALHFTANFLGGPRNGIFQVAESVPDRICTNTMIDLHNFWSFCQERVCHMWSRILRFHRDQPEEIFSGMSALMEVQEARQTASTASSSHLPHDDTTSLMQHQVPSPHATSSTHHGPVQTDVDQAPLSHTPGIPSHAVPSVSHGQVNGPPLLRIQDLASFRQALQWQIERQPQVCGLQNPQPVRVHSWFSDARRLPRSDHFRDVLLGPLPMHWPFEILNRWQDWIDPRHDVTLTLVQPQPSGGSPEVVAHVIVMQAQNPDTRAALITVVELLEDLWHPTSFCTLLPTQVTAQIIMHEAGINDRCRPLNAHQLCEVSHGTIPIDDLMTFPVRHGFQFEVALSSLDEEWDVGVNLIQIGFAQINSHIMKLDHLVKSAYWQFPMKCPARDACDHPQSISVTIIPPLRDGTPADSFAYLTFHSVLQSVWQPLSLLSARPHDPSVTVMTWFLDHIRLPQCFAARPVQLYQDPEEWTHLIRQAWVDFVLQDQPLHFHIVQPNPVDMELDAAVHILLVQQPIDGFDSILVSVIDSAFQGLPHVRHASMAPQILPYQTLLGIAYRDQDCQHAHNTCSAWVGNREILQHEFVPLTDGLSVTVAIHRHIMPPPDEPDPWDSQSPRIDQDRPHILGSGEDDWPLHLSDAQLTTALNANFFPRPKAQVITKQRHRVTLCLEAVLPDPPDTRWSQLNPDVSAISWFQQQDWATYCASFPVTLPHPIPEGIHVHPSTYHALLDLPLESDPSSWRWELYVDGSQSQGAAGWSVVVVCTDRDRSSLWGCYAGQVQLAPQHEQWIGADCQDNISAELTAFIVAQDVCMRLLPGRPTIIRPDLLLSQMIATYEQITNASPKLAQLCRVLSRWLGKNTKVDQVPAHKGHPWNELADSIARWAAVQEPASLPPWASPGIHALAGAPHDLHWCWLQNAADCVQQCFPPVVQNEIMQFPPSEVQPPIPIPLRSEEATWNTVAFSCATANVLALDHFQHQNEIGRQTGARTARLDTQLHAKGIAVIGIQEARTKQGRYRSEHYQIFSAGYQGPNPVCLGCELWIHRSMPLAMLPDGSHLTFRDFRVSTQWADPRRMFVLLENRELVLSFVVLHAPCLSKNKGDGSRPIDKLEAWWKETAQLFRTHATHDLIWVFIDANAPVNQEFHPFVGSLHAEAVNPQGRLFGNFLADARLFAPSTFDHFHDGPGHTWTHTNGSKYRRDYVLVSPKVLDIVTRTHVLHDFDTSFCHDDHLPLCLCVKGLLQKKVACLAKEEWDEQALICPVRTHAFRQALASLPIPTWNISVEAHTAWYESQLLQLGRQFFTKTKGTKTRPQLSPTTLAAIAMKRHLLDCARCWSLTHTAEFKEVITPN